MIKTDRKREINLKLHALAPWDQITIFPLWSAQNDTHFCSPTCLQAYARTCICSWTVYNLSIHDKQTHTHIHNTGLFVIISIEFRLKRVFYRSKDNHVKHHI